MATYYYDPAEESTGTPVGLTILDGTLSTFEVQNVGGELLLVMAGTGGEVVGVDAVDADANRDDVEVYFRFRIPDATNFGLWPYGRWKDVNNWYRGGGFTDGGGDQTDVVQKRVSGTNTNIAGDTSDLNSPMDITVVAGDVFHQVLRINGTSVELRYWKNDNADPGTPNLSATDSGVTGVGAAALGLIRGETYQVEFIGVGTAGDAAPQENPNVTASISVDSSTHDTINLSASASGGTAPYTYDWQRSADGSTGWTSVGTGSTLSDSGLSEQTSYFYRCVITDSGSSSDTSPTAEGKTTPEAITRAGAPGTTLTAPHVRGGGKTYVAWANDLGEFYVTEIDESTDARTTTQVDSGLTGNRHNNPTLEILPDGRLVVVYDDHGTSSPRMRVSTNANDSTLWGAAATITTDKGRYCHPIITSEGAGTERVYVFYAVNNGSGGRDAKYTYTDDRGTTWATEATIVTGGVEDAYMAARKSSATGRVLLGITPSNPDHSGAEADGHLVIYDPSGGTWEAADGTSLSLPVTLGATTLFYDASVEGAREVDWTIAAYEDATNIYAVFSTRDRAVSTDAKYIRSVWDGSTWTHQDLGADGATETLAEVVLINDGHFDTVYGLLDTDGDDVFDIFEFTTSDGGSTWSRSNLTNGYYFTYDSSINTHNLYEIKGGEPGENRWVYSPWIFTSETDYDGVIYVGEGTAAETTVAVGLAAETDTAPAVGAAKTASVGLASETDIAPAVTASLAAETIVAVGLATESDTAPGVAWARAFGVGVASETDTAPAVSAAKVMGVGLAIETDTAPAVLFNVVPGNYVGIGPLSIVQLVGRGTLTTEHAVGRGTLSIEPAD